jgi:DNA-binding transcriptional LysR family regulator
MEIRELEAFVAVAEELHFGRAAELLHLTPSRVSQAVRKLERQVGGPLFRRSSRRVQLTPLGQRLFDEVRPALSQLEGALRAARGAAGAGHDPVRVGFTNSLPERLAIALTAAFWRAHPDVPAGRYSAPTLEYVDWLDADHDGVFLSWFPLNPRELHLPRVRFGPTVLSARRAALVPADHPIAGRTEVDVEELADHDLCYPPSPPELGQRFADAWTPPLTPGGREIRRVHRASGRLLEAWEVAIREGYVYLSAEIVLQAYDLDGIVAVPVTGLPPMLLVPMWSAQRETPEVLSFIRFAVAHGTRAGWLDDRRPPAP